ncbi:MAG: RNA-binding transcriptional accessory protein [Firmicutes bacterium]|nr:RNA-binding transcriptional accessory protein [Bacillota bacterium]
MEDGLISAIARELNLRETQVARTAELLDQENTIPFIARYRKEMTGELDETVLRQIQERLTYLRNLRQRQAEVIRLIGELGKLSAELENKIRRAVTLQEVEDLYRPYRPKRRTRATIARERGLEPLARLLWAQEIIVGDLLELARPYVNPELGVDSPETALEGARDIVAEEISDNAEVRKILREVAQSEGSIAATALKPGESSPYEIYYDFRHPLKTLKPHQVLALNRGEKEEFLNVKIQIADNLALEAVRPLIIKNSQAITAPPLEEALADSYRRLIIPSLEREIRAALTEAAEDQAIRVFAANLRPLLLQPPVKGKVVMGIDPAYRTGCKVAVIDDTGKLLQVLVVYPTPPQDRVEEAKAALKALIQKHRVDLIAIGNGTASRETETFVAEMIKELPRPVPYTIVSEAGASVYSASEVAREEFPDLEASERSAASIARRLQDPLSELVKIDPKSLGVGQYQHDVDQKKLGEKLGEVVESAVNTVGVDLNTASVSLLKYVSGLRPAVARAIVAYREAKGRFSSREELRAVSGLGEKTFTQAAGFLRLPGAPNPLDHTAIHPESYAAAHRLLEKAGVPLEKLSQGGILKLRQFLSRSDLVKLAMEIGAGIPTLQDIIENLEKPGRDPREDLPGAVFRSDVLRMEDLKPGMILRGVVRNAVDFGAFVDIGVKQDGLVHISELKEGFVRHPTDVVAVGQAVNVKVLSVDPVRSRIALSMRGVNQAAQ